MKELPVVLTAVLLLSVATLAYCVITVRDNLSRGRRRLAWFGMIVALWPVLTIGWALWAFFMLSTFVT